MRLPSSLSKRLAIPLVGGLAAVVVPVVTGIAPAPAQASSSYLCTGYSGCAAAGYSDGGYGAHNRTMYWRMYSGHNCTNYVAYRMIQAGMSSSRPWGSSGMARNWGPANSSITDQVPAVGAVAWFARGLGGGSDGHVAVVERVVSATQIVISEDSWNGDFHWATLTKDGGIWPSGFVHFVDRQQTITVAKAPTVTGDGAHVGVPLAATGAAFSPATVTRTYQWLADGYPIAGATSATFVPSPAQAGKAISVRVGAARSGYVATSTTSAATAPVSPGEFSATAPVLAGEAMVGQTLTATRGTVTPDPTVRFWRWRADGKIIGRTHGATLAVTRDLVGKKITVEDVGRAQGYDDVVTAATTTAGPVLAGVITLPTEYQASGEARLGSTLALTGGVISPSGVRATVAWLRDGHAVDGAEAATYQTTDADLGHHLDAVITFSKDHYADVVRHYSFGDVITTTPVVKTTAKPRRGSAVVGVQVKAPGVGTVAGPVTVTSGIHQVQGVLDDHGHLRVVLTDLKAGVRRIVVQYAGQGYVEPGHDVVKVKVKH